MTKLIFTIIIIIHSCGKYLSADTGCGDWENFRDEKCFNVFKYVQTYDEAVNTCIQFNSTLVTITSADEQHFVENYLFANHRVIENVWIGLKYYEGKYKWMNFFEANYTNWSSGSPHNITDYCTQINSDALLLGKWTDISCAKRNLAFCQKVPEISAQHLLTTLLNSIKQIETSNQQLSAKLDDTSRQLEYALLQQNEMKLLLENTTKQLDTTLNLRLTNITNLLNTISHKVSTF